MIIKLICPDFNNGKEKRRHVKSILKALDKRFNKHVFDLGDWPLVVKFIDDNSTAFLSFSFGKTLEPDENATQTMNRVIAYMRKDLQLKIYDIEKEIAKWHLL